MGRGFFEDLRSLFIDDYKDAVRDTSGVPAVFIDPDDFDRDYYQKNGRVNPADIPKLRQQLEEQMPGFTRGATNADLATAVETSLTQGPFAVRMQLPPTPGSTTPPMSVCLVNEQGRDLNHKNELMPKLSRQDLERIREIPGWDDHWDRIIGIHEGTHCNQTPVNPSGMTADQVSVAVLSREAQADQAAIDWARRNGLNDIAQAMIDFRALGAADDPLHSTAIIIDKPGPVTLDHINAARDFRGEMISKVAADQGISARDAETMLQDRPEEFNGHIKRLLSHGAFDGNSNPHVKESIEAFSGAVDRQITGRRIEREQEHERRMERLREHHGALETNDGTRLAQGPDAQGEGAVQTASADAGVTEQNASFQTASYDVSSQAVMPSAYADMDVSTINGGAPVVALNDGDEASMTIGGVAPAAFFAANADPSLAVQRIELAQQLDVGLERDFERSAPSVKSDAYQMA
ncbi:MAG: hypothetical protein KDI61_00275 [Alphaproteobacteria bacterium]|nr:hypothetical protein [Alphaproteobacteria bacterium]